MLDSLSLAQALIRCRSVTPLDAGVIAVLSEALAGLGFVCRQHVFEGVVNLHARLGEGDPCFCFGGHTDIVPPGDETAWSSAPFAAEVLDGVLIGRGAVDMKGAVAAFVAAVARFLDREKSFKGSIVLLITGDEEDSGACGMKQLLPALAAGGEKISHCLVGEPTSGYRIGDVVKNGRRGSMNMAVRAQGIQGHAAYPEQAGNPLPVLIDFLAAIKGKLDDGAPGFAPSNLELTALEAVNPVSNVTPGDALARFNIRFNTRHSAASLQNWLTETAQQYASGKVRLDLSFRIVGEAFITPKDAFIDTICSAVADKTGSLPELSTGGGTSDARYIRDYCPVVELGLKNASAHQIDEQVPIADLEALCEIYAGILQRYFAAFG